MFSRHAVFARVSPCTTEAGGDIYQWSGMDEFSLEASTVPIRKKGGVVAVDQKKSSKNYIPEIMGRAT